MINITNSTTASKMNEVLGITDERFSEMEEKMQQNFAETISEKFIKSKSEQKESMQMDSIDILKCCQDVAENPNEVFMLGIMFTSFTELARKLSQK